MLQNNLKLQEKIKKIYDKETKEDHFSLGDVVLWWDSQNEEKGKHGRFDNLWKGPYRILDFRGENAYLLEELDGQSLPGGPVNGRFLKHYLTWFFQKFLISIVHNSLFCCQNVKELLWKFEAQGEGHKAFRISCCFENLSQFQFVIYFVSQSLWCHVLGLLLFNSIAQWMRLPGL